MRSSPTPSLEKACQAERATREWRTSPTMAIARARQIALVLTDRECIQQSLGGMGQVRFPCGQHAHVRGDVVRHQCRHAGLGVADHERVHVHRLECVHRVEHALALDARGQLHLEVHDLGAQALGGELEADTRVRVEGSVKRLATVMPAERVAHGGSVPSAWTKCCACSMSRSICAREASPASGGAGGSRLRAAGWSSDSRVPSTPEAASEDHRCSRTVDIGACDAPPPLAAGAL